MFNRCKLMDHLFDIMNNLPATNTTSTLTTTTVKSVGIGNGNNNNKSPIPNSILSSSSNINKINIVALSTCPTIYSILNPKPLHHRYNYHINKNQFN